MTNRNYQLDNAKGILIILVVYAHFISKVLGQGPAINSNTWSVVNAFHMAAFLVISGYLAKRRIDDKEYGKMLVKGFIPYLFAQLGLFLLFSATGTAGDFFPSGSSDIMIWLHPEDAMWYLLAVCVYMVVTAILAEKYGEKLWLIWLFSLLLCVAMGFVNNIGYLRLTKLTCFYPYYLLGYIIRRKDYLERINEFKGSRLAGALLTLIGLLVMVMIRIGIREIFDPKYLILMEAQKYKQYMPEEWSLPYYISGPIGRIVLIVLAVMIGIGIILLMPKKKTPLSYLGKYSIYIYVTHWYLIRLVDILKLKEHTEIIGFFRRIMNPGYNIYLLAIPFIILCCFILSSRPIRFLERPFLEPEVDLGGFLDKLMRKKEEE